MTDYSPRIGDCRMVEGRIPGFHTEMEIFDGKRWRPLVRKSNDHPDTDGLPELDL